MEKIKEIRSKFLRIECNACGNEQVVFSNPSTIVRCVACNAVLVKPTGGKTSIFKEEKSKAAITAIEEHGRLTKYEKE